MIVRTDRISGIIFGPVIWSVYFVLSYIISGFGCARGLDKTQLLGFNTVQLLLIGTGIIASLLILMAGAQAELGRRRIKRHGSSKEAVESRNYFLHSVAALLCGFSLIGTLWLILNALLSPVC